LGEHTDPATSATSTMLAMPCPVTKKRVPPHTKDVVFPYAKEIDQESFIEKKKCVGFNTPENHPGTPPHQTPNKITQDGPCLHGGFQVHLVIC